MKSIGKTLKKTIKIITLEKLSIVPSVLNDLTLKI
jgi:hypothetical protein